MNQTQMLDGIKKLSGKDKLKLGCLFVVVLFSIFIIILVIFVKTNPFLGTWSLWSPTYYSLDEQIEIRINGDNTCIFDDSSPYGNDSEGTWQISEDEKYIYFNWNNPRTQPTELRIEKGEDSNYLISNGNKWYKIK